MRLLTTIDLCACSLHDLQCVVMRWMLVVLGSGVSGVLALVLSVVLLFVSLNIYAKYVLGIVSNGAVGWDLASIFASIFGQYWQLAAIGIPTLIFGLGCILGFWLLNKWLLGSASTR